MSSNVRSAGLNTRFSLRIAPLTDTDYLSFCHGNFSPIPHPSSPRSDLPAKCLGNRQRGQSAFEPHYDCYGAIG